MSPQLRADAAAGTWQTTDDRLLAWADALLTCARAQHARAEEISPRLVATVHAESGAALLCEELRRDGFAAAGSAPAPRAAPAEPHSELHEAPRAFDVSLTGCCNLRCGWCSNPESQPMEPLPGERARAYLLGIR